MNRFKTYGTPRVYVEIGGQYHEPLYCTANSAEEAERLAAQLNREGAHVDGMAVTNAAREIMDELTAVLAKCPPENRADVLGQVRQTHILLTALLTRLDAPRLGREYPR